MIIIDKRISSLCLAIVQYSWMTIFDLQKWIIELFLVKELVGLVPTRIMLNIIYCEDENAAYYKESPMDRN